MSKSLNTKYSSPKILDNWEIKEKKRRSKNDERTLKHPIKLVYIFIKVQQREKLTIHQVFHIFCRNAELQSSVRQHAMLVSQPFSCACSRLLWNWSQVNLLAQLLNSCSITLPSWCFFFWCALMHLSYGAWHVSSVWFFSHCWGVKDFPSRIAL